MTDTAPDSPEPETAVPAVEQLALFEQPTTTPTDDSAGSTDEMTIVDMAAEMDTSVPADATEQDPADAGDEPEHTTGICRGGPYEGRVVPCRFPGGFVLYDKQRRLMWTYAAEPGRPGEFVVRSNGTPAKLANVDALRQAAEGVQLDVIAYDDGPATR